MDLESFKANYLPHYKKMYCIAFKILNNAPQAEDIVQDAFTKLWTKRDELSDVNNSEAYCIGVVKNMCLDFIRTQHNVFSTISETELMVISQKDIGKEIESADELNRVIQIMDSLPYQQKEVIKMRCINDFSFEEIEKTTGLSNINIRTLLSRGRKRLKELAEQK